MSEEVRKAIYQCSSKSAADTKIPKKKTETRPLQTNNIRISTSILRNSPVSSRAYTNPIA